MTAACSGRFQRRRGAHSALNRREIAAKSAAVDPDGQRIFTAALARDLRATEGPARVVAANNVLAHVDDVMDFMRACRELVADNGLITIEVPYVAELLERIEYDTVYHEHLSYFSITSLLRLCQATGLHVIDVDRLLVHGGSLRLYRIALGGRPRSGRAASSRKTSGAWA